MSTSAHTGGEWSQREGSYSIKCIAAGGQRGDCDRGQVGANRGRQGGRTRGSRGWGEGIHLLGMDEAEAGMLGRRVWGLVLICWEWAGGLSRHAG